MHHTANSYGVALWFRIYASYLWRSAMFIDIYTTSFILSRCYTNTYRFSRCSYNKPRTIFMQKSKWHKFNILNTVNRYSIFLKVIPLTRQRRWGHRYLCRTAWRIPMEHNATLQGSAPPLIALRELQSTQMEGKQGLMPSSSQRATCKLHLLGSSQMQSTQRSIQKYTS